MTGHRRAPIDLDSLVTSSSASKLMDEQEILCEKSLTAELTSSVCAYWPARPLINIHNTIVDFGLPSYRTVPAYTTFAYFILSETRTLYRFSLDCDPQHGYIL